MNVVRNYIMGLIVAFLAGLLFYAFYNHWIVLRAPWHMNTIINTSEIIKKKQIVLHYFHGDKWKTEKQEMLWSDDTEKNILHLINAWLTLLDEEHITTKKTTLQSVLSSSAYIVYLSFDRTFFNKGETIFKKWMLIEGLLKTLKENSIVMTHVQFLVQHQILQDSHLDFSLPWPIHGFMK